MRGGVKRGGRRELGLRKRGGGAGTGRESVIERFVCVVVDCDVILIRNLRHSFCANAGLFSPSAWHLPTRAHARLFVCSQALRDTCYSSTSDLKTVRGVGSMVRRLLNWICPIVLLLVYMKALFLDPTAIEGEMSPTVAGTIPSETWLAMSPTARGLAPQLAGWALCWVWCMLAFLIFEPTERTIPYKHLHHASPLGTARCCRTPTTGPCPPARTSTT